MSDAPTHEAPSRAPAEEADPNPAGAPNPPDFNALRSTLPDGLRDDPALRPYTSFEGMARSLVEAQKMVGKRIEDASPEELSRFHARYGRPEAPDGYVFVTPGAEGVGDASGAASEEPALLDAARQWFFEAGLNQRQAEVLVEKWSAFAGEADRMTHETRSQAESELRSEWGLAYDRNVGRAARAAREFGGAPLAAYLEESGLGNDPRLVRAFACIADAVGEDALVGAADPGFALSPAAAREEIAKVMGSAPYFDANHPEHAATVERMRSLFAAAYPEARS